MDKIYIVDLQPSLWFRNARVIILNCGHRHVRPRSMGVKLGQEFVCCFCEEAKKPLKFQDSE